MTKKPRSRAPRPRRAPVRAMVPCVICHGVGKVPSFINAYGGKPDWHRPNGNGVAFGAKPPGDGWVPWRPDAA